MSPVPVLGGEVTMLCMECSWDLLGLADWALAIGVLCCLAFLGRLLLDKQLATWFARIAKFLLDL